MIEDTQLAKALPNSAWLGKTSESLEEFEHLLRRICHKCDAAFKPVSDRCARAQLKVCPLKCNCNHDLDLETAIAWVAAENIVGVIVTLRGYDKHTRAAFNEDVRHGSLTPDIIRNAVQSFINDVETNLTVIRGLVAVVSLHKETMPYLSAILNGACNRVLETKCYIMQMKRNFEVTLRSEEATKTGPGRR